MIPQIITIAGSSGVGKSTISKLIARMLGEEKCLLISGDDLHKWERKSPFWEEYTHLNPEANDLDLGLLHLKRLKSNKSIQRRIYNHSIGEFSEEKTLFPKEFIIYEGLHALFDERVNNISDIKIFIDTNSELKKKWKIKRDTDKRGYTKEKVLQELSRRLVDEEKYIENQIFYADIVFLINEKDHQIKISYLSNDKNSQFAKDVVDFYLDFELFIKFSKEIGQNEELVQGTGGNLSCKTKHGLLIKSSGANLKNIGEDGGFSLYSQDGRTLSGDLKPSMEKGFHLKLPWKYVVHTHPIYLNAILCSKTPFGILESIFSKKEFVPHSYLPYVTPGDELESVVPNCNIIFLQNHGLIVSSDDIEDAVQKTLNIENAAKIWFAENTNFTNNCQSEKSQFLFPDAAIFPEKMTQVNNFILSLIIGAGLHPNFLSKEEVETLNNMPGEQYRKTL